MLCADLSPGERIVIGDITITLVHKTGRRARLLIRADRDMPVQRVAHHNETPSVKIRREIVESDLKSD